MEYHTGGDLSDRIAGCHDITPRTSFVKIIKQLSDALGGELISKGVVHRLILGLITYYLDRIMIDAHFDLDFGIAQQHAS